MNKLWLTVLIALLIAVCLAQRGGGGGGGGGRGGRGGSSTRTSCSKKCGSDQACLQKCRAGANSGPISGEFIALIVCGILGPIMAVVGCGCLCSFFQNDSRYVVVVSSVQIVKERPFISQLKISGSDHVGVWDAVAFILCRDGGIQMWLYKQYIERLQAGQTGKWDHLLHVSSIFLNGEELKGKWSFLGFEEEQQIQRLMGITSLVIV